MSLYAQFDISNWEFKTNRNDTYLLDYINKETITYNACGHAKVSLSMQVVSDGLKEFITNSDGFNLTLYRHRTLKTDDGVDIDFDEVFRDIKIESYREDAVCENVCEITLTAKTGDVED